MLSIHIFALVRPFLGCMHNISQITSIHSDLALWTEYGREIFDAGRESWFGNI